MGINLCYLWTCISLLTENNKPIYTVICEQAKITWLQGWLFLHTWNKKIDKLVTEQKVKLVHDDYGGGGDDDDEEEKE